MDSLHHHLQCRLCSASEYVMCILFVLQFQIHLSYISPGRSLGGRNYCFLLHILLDKCISRLLWNTSRSLHILCAIGTILQSFRLLLTQAGETCRRRPLTSLYLAHPSFHLQGPILFWNLLQLSVAAKGLITSAKSRCGIMDTHFSHGIKSLLSLFQSVFLQRFSRLCATTEIGYHCLKNPFKSFHGTLLDGFITSMTN